MVSSKQTCMLGRVGSSRSSAPTDPVSHAPSGAPPANSPTPVTSGDTVSVSPTEGASGIQLPDYSWLDPGPQTSNAGSSTVQHTATPSIAYATQGETTSLTSDQLHIRKGSGNTSAEVGVELDRQRQAKVESERRADQGMSVQNQMNQAHRQSQQGLTQAQGQRWEHQEASHAVENNIARSEQAQDKQRQQAGDVVAAGEKQQAVQAQAQERVSDLEGQTSQADSEAQTAHQSASEAEKQTDEASRKAQQQAELKASQEAEKKNTQEQSSGPPGQAKKGKGGDDPAASGPGKKGGPPAKAEDLKAKQQEEAKRAQQAAQQKLAQAQQEESRAKQKQEQLAQQTTQARKAAETQRGAVEQIRSRLGSVKDVQNQSRNTLQSHREDLRDRNDAIRDIGTLSKGMAQQVDEAKEGVRQASGSRDKNLKNAEAARGNMETLSGVQKQLKEKESQKPDGRSKLLSDFKNKATDQQIQSSKPAGLEGADSASLAGAQGGRQSERKVDESEDTLSIKLASLNSGLNNRQDDQTLSRGGGRSSVDEAANIADAEIAAAAAGSRANSSQDSGPTISSGPGNSDFGHAQGKGNDGGGPGNSDFGHSHGKGKGK